MHILILSDLYPPFYKGGHELQCEFVADALSRRGNTVDVLTSRYGSKFENNVRGVYRLLYYIELDGEGKRRRAMQLKGIVMAISNYFITRSIIKKIRPDVVYAGQMTNISIYPLRAIARFRLPVIHHVGNRFFIDLVKSYDLEKNAIKKIFRRIYYGYSGLRTFQCQHLIAVSEMLKKKYAEVGFSEERLSVVPPVGIPLKSLIAVDEASVAPEGETLKLLYVGRLVPEKGAHIAIESISILKNQLGVHDVNLDIFGDGNLTYIEDLRSIIKKHDLVESVSLKGKVPHEEMVKRYHDYSILLVPSIWEEPFGMIILEAFSQGLPVIATKRGGIQEIIEDGRTGFLVPPEDSRAMAEAVRKIKDNPDLRRKMIFNGIEEIRAYYSEESVITKIEAIITGLHRSGKERP